MSKHGTTAFAAFLLLVSACRAFAEEQGDGEKVPKAAAPASVAPGNCAWLKYPDGMAYFLRVPASYDAKKGARLVVFLHGSNMNGLAYLRSFEAKGWCKDDILLCPNGEQGRDVFGANNFTFGSASPITDVVAAVKKAFKVTRTYIGGHSQGGFVTYSVIMLYPRMFQGAFPMAGDCWMQNEPNLWEENIAESTEQRKIAIAVIHGRADPVVQFSQGEHAHGVFEAMGYPKLKLYAPKDLGHQFMLSPVDEALSWLDAMVGDDPEHCMKCAEGWAKAGNWADAVPAALRVQEIKAASGGQKNRAKALLANAEKAAKPAADAMLKSIETDPGATWVPKWYEFRRSFGSTKAAEPLIKTYESLRKSQKTRGELIFETALDYGRSGKKDLQKASLQELLEKAPATYHAWYAMSWLKDWKD